MSINFSGLASGLDTNSIIAALVGAQRVPIQRTQALQSGLEVKISKFGELSSALDSLKTAAEDLGSVSDLLAFAGTSSDEDLLSVTTDSTAQPGSYDVVVSSLASAEKNRSTAFASENAEVTEGTLDIAVNGGAATSITITAGMTLTQLAEEINASDADVNASIVSDGTSSYLQVTGTDTGFTTGSADDAITLTESYTGGSGQALGLVQFAAAENATATVDGLAVTSQTNTIEGAIQGVTLDLDQVGTTVVDVKSDPEKALENVQLFLDAYNAVAGFLQNEGETTEDSDRRVQLSGDAMIRSLQSSLSNVVSGFVSGATGDYNALSQIGIKTDPNGLLELDEDDFKEALAKDPDSVTSIFLAEDSGVLDSLSNLSDAYTDGTDGLIKTRTDALQTRVDRMDDQIIRLEDRLGRFEERLQAQFTALETTISSINAQGAQFAAITGSSTASNAAPGG